LRLRSLMKHIVFLQARGAAAALHDSLLTSFAPHADRGSVVAVNIVQDNGAPTPWDAVLEIWSEEPDTRLWVGKGIDRHVSRSVAYLVSEFVEKDIGPDRRWPTEGPKLIVPWVGRADLTPAERRRHWDEHVPLANRIHVGCTRYVRNWVEAPIDGDTAPPYQGIAMQHFPTVRDLQERSFDSPASVQAIHEDVAEFIAEHVVLQTVEYFRTASRP